MEVEFNSVTYKMKFWNGEELGQNVAYDSETTMAPFTTTPDFIIGSAYAGRGTVYLISPAKLELFFKTHPKANILGQNLPFDFDVVKKAVPEFNEYTIYDEDRVRDTGVLYRLWHLARIGYVPHRYNLALLCEQLLGCELEKGEERVGFGQFQNQPIEEIPSSYLRYAAKDAIATYLIYFKLRSRIAPLDKFNTLLSHSIQVKGDLALNRIYKRGIGFDTERASLWLRAADARLARLQNRLATWGWVRGTKGIQARYESIIDFLKLPLPLTEDGKISSKSEDLIQYAHIPFIKDFLAFGFLEKQTSFVRDQCESRIHPRYNLLVNTGRTSCAKPNIQQLPRGGCIRSMYVAKTGHSLIITDYAAIELATLAQVLLNKYGHSVMAQKINDGIDLHKYYASVMNECSLADVTKGMRQEAKAANFGFSGALGIDTFIQFSRGYGLELTRPQAQKMKDAWFTAFPEMKEYLKDNDEGATYTLTGRRRANASYCAAANTPFQGLASDGAKLALYELDKAKLNVVAFIHDEAVIESNNVAQDKVKVESIMIEAMKEVSPNVKISVESQVSRRFCK
jgi:DNA polymerase I-like protein with 3'-5' exonuclease and polymerase domains